MKYKIIPALFIVLTSSYLTIGQSIKEVKKQLTIPGVQIIQGTAMSTFGLYKSPSVTDNYEELFFSKADPNSPLGAQNFFCSSRAYNGIYDTVKILNPKGLGSYRSMRDFAQNIFPWITPDGNTIYWTHIKNGTFKIVYAKRDSIAGSFHTTTSEAEGFSNNQNYRLTACWLSRNELTMYVTTQINQPDSVSDLLKVTRNKTSDKFYANTITKLKLTGISIKGYLTTPSLTPNEDELFLVSRWNLDSSSVLSFVRSAPNTYSFNRQYYVNSKYQIESCQLSKDGLRLYFTLRDTLSLLSNIYYTERPSLNSDFLLNAKDPFFNDSPSLIRLYPIPSSYEVFIESMDQDNVFLQFELLNSAGQTVISHNFSSPLMKWSFDVSSLPQGIYLYRIKSTLGLEDGKIVVQN